MKRLFWFALGVLSAWATPYVAMKLTYGYLLVRIAWGCRCLGPVAFR